MVKKDSMKREGMRDWVGVWVRTMEWRKKGGMKRVKVKSNLVSMHVSTYVGRYVLRMKDMWVGR